MTQNEYSPQTHGTGDNREPLQHCATEVDCMEYPSYCEENEEPCPFFNCKKRSRQSTRSSRPVVASQPTPDTNVCISEKNGKCSFGSMCPEQGKDNSCTRKSAIGQPTTEQCSEKCRRKHCPQKECCCEVE